MVCFLIGPMLLQGFHAQGTVLGPLLFLLHVNDLDCVVKNSTIKLFPNCYMPHAANTQQECSALQDDLTVISNWANHWQLKLNVKL